MGNSGYDWAAYAFMQESASDWDGDLLADAATDTGDVVSLDVKAACEVSIKLVENDTGAIDGDVTVHVLRDVDGANFEDTVNSGAWAFNITPVQSDTVYKVFSIDPSQIGSFKLAVENESGQELAVSVKIRTADWPVAS